jgi:16S rRNA (guanine1516-N2)-methyltransferase
VNTLAVSNSEPSLLEEAQALAAELQIPFLNAGESLQSGGLLRLCADGLQLEAVGSGDVGALKVDFGGGKMRYRRQAGHNEPLGRAVGVGKRPGLQVVDATAGLGRDSFVLADLGCEVTMLERSPAAFALLRDGLRRAASSGDPWLQTVSGRMRLHYIDSPEWLAAHPNSVDVVYLDPMFPERKKSARVKKEMWLFQQLIDGPGDEELLLETALDAAHWRVVVKRPIKAQSLPGPASHHALRGKTIRYDVYNCSPASD